MALVCVAAPAVLAGRTVAAADLLRNDEVTQFEPLVAPPLASIYTGLYAGCSGDATVTLDPAGPGCAPTPGEGASTPGNGSSDGDDLYVLAPAVPFTDPDQGLLVDPARPLIAWQVADIPTRNSLRAIKAVAQQSVSLVYTANTGVDGGSNTAFKLSKRLYAGQNLVSLPYFYYPNGDVASLSQSSEDLCLDLATGGCKPRSISTTKRSAAGADITVVYPCGRAFGRFAIAAGAGYWVDVAADCRADIVGAADDRYSTRTPPASGGLQLHLLPGRNLVSLPYHLRAVSSRDLCNQVAASYPPGLNYIVRFPRDASGKLLGPQTSACVPWGGWALMPGEAYILSPQSGTIPLDFQFETY